MPMTKRVWPILTILIILLEASAEGAEPASSWPEFRGPTGQGVSRERRLPVEWGTARNIAWKRPIPGTGWSSPVYAHDRIYLTTAVPLGVGEYADQSLRAMCLDGHSGNTIWDVEVFRQEGATAPTIQSKNSHASPTPVLHEKHIYVHFGHQGTACVSLSGEIVWQTREIRYEPVHGNGGSPIVVDDLLVFSCDGRSNPFVIALDRLTGQKRWRTKRNIEAAKPFSFSTPLLIHVDGHPQIISPGSEMVAAYSPATGQEIWRVRYPTGYSVVPRPVYGHGLVYVCSGYGRPSLLAIRPDGQGDVTETHVEWQTDRGVPHNPSVLLSGDLLFMVSDRGVASCLNARTGQVQWTERLGGNFSASPLLADGKIYFQDETGTTHVVKAEAQFERLATNSIDAPEERTFASYAVATGAIYLRSEKHLFKIEADGLNR